MCNQVESSLERVKLVLNLWIKQYNEVLQETNDKESTIAIGMNEFDEFSTNIRAYAKEVSDKHLTDVNPKLAIEVMKLAEKKEENLKEGLDRLYVPLFKLERLVKYVQNLGIKGISLQQGKQEQPMYAEAIKQTTIKWVNIFNEAYVRKADKVLLNSLDFWVFYESLQKYFTNEKGTTIEQVSRNIHMLLEKLNTKRLDEVNNKNSDYFPVTEVQFEQLMLFVNKEVNPIVLPSKEKGVVGGITNKDGKIAILEEQLASVQHKLKIECIEHEKTKESMNAKIDDLYNTISELTDDLVTATEKADDLAKTLGYAVHDNKLLETHEEMIAFDTETNLPPMGNMHEGTFFGNIPFVGGCMAKHEYPSTNSIIAGKPANGKNMYVATGLRELAEENGLMKENKESQELNLKEDKSENKCKGLKLKGNIVEQMKEQGLLVDFGPSFPDKFTKEPNMEQQIGKQILENYNSMSPEFKKMVGIQTFIAFMRQMADMKMAEDVAEQSQTSNPFGEDVISLLKKQKNLPVFVVTHNGKTK
ncbi:hypothetical protein ACQUY5_23655 [Bacillus cereus]|uniref:hypothetical protein n=1 Tax=Bacillus cereus TaxID=1396 RepID=UPI003D16A62D